MFPGGFPEFPPTGGPERPVPHVPSRTTGHTQCPGSGTGANRSSSSPPSVVSNTWIPHHPRPLLMRRAPSLTPSLVPEHTPSSWIAHRAPLIAFKLELRFQVVVWHLPGGCDSSRTNIDNNDANLHPVFASHHSQERIFCCPQAYVLVPATIRSGVDSGRCSLS